MLSNLTRRAVVPALRPGRGSFAPGFNKVSFRAFASGDKSATLDKIQEVHDQMLGCNWGDYLELVHNEPFWSAEMASLEGDMGGLLGDKDVKAKWDYLSKATDCMYACEDVRDHINEILELMTRKTGILGMGINAGEEISNMEEQTQMLTKRYEELKAEFPDFKPKIEQSVGHGLAILRMKYKFPMPGGHRFFY